MTVFVTNLIVDYNYFGGKFYCNRICENLVIVAIIFGEKNYRNSICDQLNSSSQLSFVEKFYSDCIS